MQLSQFNILSFISGIFYLILAIGVWGGRPSFYREPQSNNANFEEELKAFVPWVFFLMLIFLVTAWNSVFFTAIGPASFWLGLRLRSMLFSATRGPVPWLKNSITLKWPMLVFDFWTLGVIALFWVSLFLLY